MSRYLSRPRRKYFILLFLIHFGPTGQQNSFWLLTLDCCDAALAAPQSSKVKSQLLRELELGLAQGLQRNKWQGPALGGKDAVYAGCGP